VLQLFIIYKPIALSGLSMKRYISSGVVLSIVLVLGLWAFWIEPASLQNETHRLDIPNWPSSCSGFRIALLSDLHLGSPFNGLDKLKQVVNLSNAAQPDIVLLAGDYVIHGVRGGTFIEPEPTAAHLAQLNAPLGVYAVLGNHDWWYNAAKVRRAFEQQQISVLENQAVEIQFKACHFWLVGMGDFTERRYDIKRSLASVPPGKAVLALTHNPDLFPLLPPQVNLTLAGHTHGGQVYLPIVGRPVIPSQYGQRYAIGHIVEQQRHLFVTPGLGTSILPVRFRVPPEVTILDIFPLQET
jgi:predicted MPP superfamily phosphohydrolase